MEKTTTTQQQVEQFQRDGFVVVENALSDSQLSLIKDDLSKWVQESK
jgi:ectoine hydroxylase-related dioxygenase (phytanoyl-CoA dioxygenase family)